MRKQLLQQWHTGYPKREISRKINGASVGEKWYSMVSNPGYKGISILPTWRTSGSGHETLKTQEKFPIPQWIIICSKSSAIKWPCGINYVSINWYSCTHSLHTHTRTDRSLRLYNLRALRVTQATFCRSHTLADTHAHILAPHILAIHIHAQIDSCVFITWERPTSLRPPFVIDPIHHYISSKFLKAFLKQILK